MLGDDGLLREGRPGRVVIDMSTVSVAASQAVAEAASAAGVGYLRAPVSGNPSVVEAGNLTIMVSGDREAFERLEPVLHEIGPNVFYLGGGDEARVMKLTLNLVIAGTTELMAEALVLGEASGLERAAMLEVMGASAIGSPYVRYKTPALVADDYTATFTASMMHKDVILALDAGRAVAVPLPVAELVRRLLEDCISTGMGDIDLTALLPRLAREAGRPTVRQVR
jgi:3-hydroxyisobutyrate dehydrogenase-like beta-hydroxyacid dehydrogenase